MSLIETEKLSPHAQSVLRYLKESLSRAPNEWRALELWLSSFYSFQLDWLLDWHRFALLNKARQIGASHTYAGAAVLWGLLGENTTIVSIGETEGVEVLEKAAGHMRVLMDLGSRWVRPVRETSTMLRFQSNGRILVLPSTSGGRGFSGNVLLDEFAYHKDPKKVWDGASGTITHGGRLRVMSTPNGVGNLWHEIFTDPAKHTGYRIHQVTLQQAIDAGMVVDKDDCWKQARNDPRVFDQLFNCSFLGGDLQYIPTEDVNACSTDDLYTFDGYYYAGLDVGRIADRTVLVVVRKDPVSGIRTVARIVSLKRTLSDELERVVDEAFRKFKLKRLCVDSTGLGAFPSERLQRRHGRTRVEPVSFTMQSKEELAGGLYSAFTERTVKIPRTEKAITDLRPGLAEQLRQDVCAIRRISNINTGNIRYDAPNTESGHADSAWALALALHASGGPNRQRHTIHLTGGPEKLY